MIESKILSRLEQGEILALVTIIDKSGSAPRLPGSKMIVDADGRQHGTIGGGRLEYMAAEAARSIARGASSTVTEFDLRGEEGDSDMVCGGVQLVLIERLTPEMVAVFRQAEQCFAAGKQGLWHIDITDHAHPRRRFCPVVNGQVDCSVPPDIDVQALLRSRTTRLVRSSRQLVVLDPLPKNGTVVLFGGGHVSLEVAALAAYIDFDVIVCDDRDEFANNERFPMAMETQLVDFTDVFSGLDCRGELYLLIITRGHGSDQEVLAQALRTRARYIGMIGSRRKRDIIYTNLRQQGFTEADFARVHCPVGLAIGSETPREIAVSITAEIIAARAGVL